MGSFCRIQLFLGIKQNQGDLLLSLLMSEISQ